MACDTWLRLPQLFPACGYLPWQRSVSCYMTCNSRIQVVLKSELFPAHAFRNLSYL
jgi:hypothetical protein